MATYSAYNKIKEIGDRHTCQLEILFGFSLVEIIYFGTNSIFGFLYLEIRTVLWSSTYLLWRVL